MTRLPPDSDEMWSEIRALSLTYATDATRGLQPSRASALIWRPLRNDRIPMSPAAAALLRTLIARGQAPRDRILLSDAQSVDWRSLTFAGERHLLQLRVPPPGSEEIVKRMCAGLEDAEFSIAGVVVADIAVVGSPSRELDGSISFTIEALTVTED